MELGIVKQIDIDQEMQTAYLDYAMSVIVARALPDVRDGLKPVQRRILYAMHDMGLRPDRPYKKSARIVGEVLGKYHPHGDEAVYEAMARMAQDFSLRYPLVDGQGNFGCFTGDTKIKLLDGTERSFEELARLGPDEVFHVYSVDDKGRIVIGEGRNARVTRRKAALVEVTLDNGERVRCTPDHRFMLRDGTYKPAQELTPNDSLMPGYFDTAPVKEGLNDYLQVLQPVTGVYEFVHHLADQFNVERGMAQPASGPFVRHHKNGNRWDNRPANIERMEFLAHLHLHAEQIQDLWTDDAFRELQRQGVARYYDEHPEVRQERSERFARQNQDEEFRRANGPRVSASLRRYFADNPQASAEISNRMRALWTDADYRARMRQALAGIEKRELTSEEKARVAAIISEKSRAMWSDDAKRAEIAEAIAHALASEEVRAKMREASVRNWQDPDYRARFPESHFSAMAHSLWSDPQTAEEHRQKIARQWADPAFREAHRQGVQASNARRLADDPEMMSNLAERAAAILTEKWEDDNYTRQVMRRKIAGYVARLLSSLQLEDISPEVYEANRDANWIPHFEKALGYFDDAEQMVAAARSYNHRIVAVHWLEESADVYDITVDRYHNFSLASGIFVHNSIDGDNPAAMRYTEARLSAIAEEMLADIDKDTVDFNPNFDGTLTEPSVLPAVLPNLIVNGAAGIAVGMTTNVPPHNLGEVCDALVYLIDNYQRLDDVGVEDLARFVQGPDFPTGGVVYRYAGESDEGDRNDVILNAYAMGRGQLTVQARAHIEEMSRNRSRIVITELPYMVNKTRLIERIAELVREGRLEGITDLRDESDRQGMRIIIEMTRTVEPRTTLSQLFKLTPMQQTFGMMMVALVDGEPRLLSLKKVLTHYLDHRQEVITRRSKFLLERAKQRAHILEGLLIALDHIDEVIALIRRSRNADTARENLMKQFKLTEVQAQAILDMQLRRLAALERKRIQDEYKEKLEEIKFLQSLLRSPARIRGVIRDELTQLKEKYGDPRRTQIVDREKGYHTTHDLVEAEDVIVTLWQGGEVTRSTRPPALGKTGVLAQWPASTRDQVAFFAASGQSALASVHQVPDDRGMPVSGLTTLDRAETLVGAVVLPKAEDEEAEAPGFLTLATRGGRIKRVTLEDFVPAASRGAVSAINVEAGDQLGWVQLTHGQDEVILVTKQGKAIRFSEEEVRPMGLAAAGVLAVKLGTDDAVVGMGLATGPVFAGKAFVVTVSEQGYAKRTSVKEFPVQKRYAVGTQAAKSSKVSGLLAVAAVAAEGQQLALTTTQGEVVTFPTKAIPTMARAAAGQKKRVDTKESLVEPAKQGQPAILTVLAPPPAGAGGGQARPDGDGAGPGREGPAPRAGGQPHGGNGYAASRQPAPGKTARTRREGPAAEAAQQPAAKAAAPGAAKAAAPGAAKAAPARGSGKGRAAESEPAKKPAVKAPAGKGKAATSGPAKKAAAKTPAGAAAGEDKAAASRPAKKPGAKAPAAKGKATTARPAEKPAGKAPAARQPAAGKAKTGTSKPAATKKPTPSSSPGSPGSQGSADKKGQKGSAAPTSPSRSSKKTSER